MLINEASDEELHKEIARAIGGITHDLYSTSEQFSDHTLHRYRIADDAKYTILVQLRALGLIKESEKKRSIRDTATYWTLTPYGDQTMVNLRAISRSGKERKTVGEEAEQTNEDDA